MLNALIANMKVKKFLQIADNVCRSEESVTITATKATFDPDLDVANLDLKSEEINISLSHPSPSAQSDGTSQKYLSSVTSMTIRLPAFDHVCLNDKAYMKIKSDEFMFAKSGAVTSSESNVVIVPTDDPRLKVIIIPGECLA